MNEISIIAANELHCLECLSILADSVLGSYFEPELAKSILSEGQCNQDLFVAVKNDKVLGFYQMAKKGAFLVFPYLHLLAVNTSLRGQGIGALLLNHFEGWILQLEGYPFRPKIFLLVSEQNLDVIRFYERQGYSKKTAFENMFAEGDTELLMMKDLGMKQKLVNLVE